MAETPVLFNTVVTPNPQELAFYQLVASTSMRPDLIPAIGTTYREWANTFSPPIRISEGWGDYVFTTTKEGPVIKSTSDRYMAFYFAKNKTQAERDTPFAEYPTNRNYSWPPVLEELVFIRNWVLPMTGANASGTVSVPRVFAHRKIIPAAVVNSRCMVQLFLSEVEWPATYFNNQQPIPTEVSWQFLGNQDNIGRCLHGDIVIPSEGGGQAIFGAGTQGTASISSTPNQIFPATTFLTWRPFVLDHTQEYVEATGQFLRQKIIIYPPPLPQSQQY